MNTTTFNVAGRSWLAKRAPFALPLSASCALLIGALTAQADTLVLFPDGGFDSPAGANGDWVEVGGGVTWSYPTTGGNPGGYGVMTDNPTPTWGIWVGGNTTPLPTGPMGMIPGGTYNFVQDMKTLTSGGGSAGGVKIESWGPAGKISDSGDMRAASESGVWETYTFPYTLAPGTTGIKVVPLWAPNAVVGYDNIGVMVPPQPLIAAIDSPVEGDTVSSITFTINASAVVSPGTVTNVAFYDGATLLGNDTSYPYNLAYSGAAVGSHALTVVAKDNNGNTTTSTAVNVTVDVIAPPAPNYPTNNAPMPIWPKANVISLYNSSATYTDRAPINWYPWGSTRSSGDFAISGGNTVKSYLGLGYAGVEPNPGYNLATAMDISKMTTMHLDVWTTADQLAIKMVSSTFNGAAPEVIYDAASGVISTNHWLSLDIPLSVFTNINSALNLGKVDQLLWIDNGDIVGPGIQQGDFYIDNVYFYNNTPVIQHPARSGANFTLQVASQTGISYVLEATPALTPATWTSLQTNAGSGTMLNFTNAITPGSSSRFFRVRTQ